MLEFIYLTTTQGNRLRINPAHIEGVLEDPSIEGTRIDMVSGSFYSVKETEGSIMHEISKLRKK